MQVPQQSLLPQNPGQRIVSIDTLRGFAVLGILIMNIQHFSMIGAAYINPTAYGDLGGINKWVWIFSHLLGSEKFMSIFSILFGAGIVLFTERALAKGRRGGPLHYRRNFWLLLFGLIHAYLIWHGDILVTYSLCAFLVFVFRKMKPLTLVLISMLFFIVPLSISWFFGSTMQYWPEEAYNDNMQSWLPDTENVQKELAAMQGSWINQMDYRIPGAIFMETFLFFIQTFWRVTSMMLLGMALYKWGVLSATRSKVFYQRMTIIGLLVGFVIVGFGIQQNFQKNWSMEYSMFFGYQFNYIGSVAVALGYIGLIMLIIQSGVLKCFVKTLSSVGKMAFSNYILMSLICTFIFYGHGLGLFGKVERWAQILFVFVIWILLLVGSPLWLKKYRYGPLEWVWRALSYWKKPEFKN